MLLDLLCSLLLLGGIGIVGELIHDRASALVEASIEHLLGLVRIEVPVAAQDRMLANQATRGLDLVLQC